MEDESDAKKQALLKLISEPTGGFSEMPKLGMGDLQRSDAIQRGYLPNEKDATFMDRMGASAKDYLYNKTPEERVDEGIDLVIGSLSGPAKLIPKFNIKTLTDVERSMGKLEELKSILNPREIQDYVNYNVVPKDRFKQLMEIVQKWRAPVIEKPRRGR